MPTTLPYGSWPSIISSELLVEEAVGLSDVKVSGDEVWWNEGRAQESGRQVLVSSKGGGVPTDRIPVGFSCRTAVHEYGGNSYALISEPADEATRAVFTQWADQCLWILDESGTPRRLTAKPSVSRGHRFADLSVVAGGRWLLAIRERHAFPGSDAAGVDNDVVAIALPTATTVGETPASAGETPASAGETAAGEAPVPEPIPAGDPLLARDPTPAAAADADADADGAASAGTLAPVIEVVASGHDFYAFPRPSPDGRRVAWVSWDHPSMPWDSTELWVADLAEDASVSGTRKVAGGPGESVTQPVWSPDGRLHYISDRSGWWNIYLEDGTTVAPLDAEFAGPDWQLGQSSYVFLDDGRLVATWSAPDGQRLGVVPPDGTYPGEPGGEHLQAVPVGYTSIHFLRAQGAFVVAVDTGAVEVLRRSRTTSLDSAWLSVPEAIEFPTTGGLRAHALWYAPTNPDVGGPPGERPPVMVISHGGPTSATSAVLSYGIQYWTSRGFGVVDVNYGGSTGYGRAYRQRLDGRWGIVDVDDSVAAARWLADQGLVDGERMVIRGRSAGGYTTLAALTFRDVFAAGASHFGVADLELLARDTHKFESRYLDGLIGPYPEAIDTYHERSPIYHVEDLRRPLILFQGLEDAVVPPAQASLIADALAQRGIPVAHLTFEGEQHGFRQAATIRRVIDTEMAFYGRVLGFVPADATEPFEIVNEEALRR
jgi:dipeptidyl aminopeptidase/acylaminoacyl peptidase